MQCSQASVTPPLPPTLVDPGGLTSKPEPSVVMSELTLTWGGWGDHKSANTGLKRLLEVSISGLQHTDVCWWNVSFSLSALLADLRPAGLFIITTIGH